MGSRAIFIKKKTKTKEEEEEDEGEKGNRKYFSTRKYNRIQIAVNKFILVLYPHIYIFLIDKL